MGLRDNDVDCCCAATEEEEEDNAPPLLLYLLAGDLLLEDGDGADGGASSIEVFCWVLIFFASTNCSKTLLGVDGGFGKAAALLSLCDSMVQIWVGRFYSCGAVLVADFNGIEQVLKR